MASENADVLDQHAQAQRDRIGQVHRHPLGVVDARTIRRYALAIGDMNPLYHDGEAARAAGHADIVAPPNLLSAIVDWGAGKPESDLSADGTARKAGSPLKVMGAGEEMEMLLPVTAGTELWAEEEVIAVELKQGRSGPLLFVTIRHDFVDASGTAYNRNRRTVMVRA